jgi:hypothetical protein
MEGVADAAVVAVPNSFAGLPVAPFSFALQPVGSGQQPAVAEVSGTGSFEIAVGHQPTSPVQSWSLVDHGVPAVAAWEPHW